MPRTRTKVGKLALVPNDELCLMWSTVEYVGCGAHGRVDRAPWDRDRRPVPKPGRFWTNFRALRVLRAQANFPSNFRKSLPEPNNVDVVAQKVE